MGAGMGAGMGAEMATEMCTEDATMCGVRSNVWCIGALGGVSFVRIGCGDSSFAGVSIRVAWQPLCAENLGSDDPNF